MGGTSVGGLLTAAYTTPSPIDQNSPKFTAQEVVNNFKALAKNVFPELHWWQTGLTKPLYDRTNLQTSCNQFFSTTLFKDSLRKVHIPVADVPNRKARVLRSYKVGIKNPTLETQDVIFATTSAPTFFLLYPLQLADKTIVTGDGGLFANNPTPLVFSDVKKRYPEKRDRCRVYRNRKWRWNPQCK